MYKPNNNNFNYLKNCKKIKNYQFNKINRIRIKILKKKKLNQLKIKKN